MTDSKIQQTIMKAGLFLLIVSTFSFTGFTNKQATASDFEVKIDSFLKKYLQDFKASKENYNYNGNDLVLDNKTNPVWKRKLTLKRNTPFINSNQQTVYQRLYLAFYKYESKQQCNSAMDSLMNCFGTNCWSIKQGENIKAVHSPPNIYIINEKEIIVCHLGCEHLNDFWEIFQNDLITTFGNTGSELITCGCGGPLNFRKL